MAEAQVVVCVTSAAIHLVGPTEEEERWLKVQNQMLEKLFGEMKTELHQAVESARTNVLPDQKVERIQFAENRCRALGLVILTSGSTHSAQLYFNQGEKDTQKIFETPFESRWRLSGSPRLEDVRDLLRAAIVAFLPIDQLAKVRLGVYCALIAHRRPKARRLSENEQANCPEATCAVLPSMDWNDALMNATFELHLKLESGFQRVVQYTGQGACLAYDSKDPDKRGILLGNSTREATLLQAPWENTALRLSGGSITGERSLCSSPAAAKTEPMKARQ